MRFKNFMIPKILLKKNGGVGKNKPFHTAFQLIGVNKTDILLYSLLRGQVRNSGKNHGSTFYKQL
jgi:hypothetical protein